MRRWILWCLVASGGSACGKTSEEAVSEADGSSGESTDGGRSSAGATSHGGRAAGRGGGATGGSRAQPSTGGITSNDGGAGPEETSGAGGEPAFAGGDAASGGESGTGGEAGSASTAVPTVMIADCEAPSLIDPSVHDGYKADPVRGFEIAWSTYTDKDDALERGTALGTITPAEGDPFVCVQDVFETETAWVFNAKGSGFTQWGAGMELTLDLDAPLPTGVDLSSFRLIRFWAKVNSATTGAIRLMLIDAQTTPTARGGTCTGETGACENYFGHPLVTLSLEWQQFVVPFTMLKQATWSSQMFPAPDLTQVFGFRFQAGKTSFDYSIDNVELVP